MHGLVIGPGAPEVVILMNVRGEEAMNTDESARAGTPPNAAGERQPTVAAPAVAMRIFDFLVALVFILFVWAHVVALTHVLRLSILMILAKALVEIQYYVRNSTSHFVNSSVYAWLIALCGTVAALLFRPADGASDCSVGIMLQAIGLAILAYVIVTLDRNPESVFSSRGVSRDGLYRFVRHPFYLAFMLCGYGYVLNHTTLYNVGVLALVTLLQVLRVKEEERLLRDDCDFQEYTALTRWKVVPGVY